MCYKNTESHTRNVKHPLCNNKAHRKEEVGGWNEGQDDQRQSLQGKKMKQNNNKKYLEMSTKKHMSIKQTINLSLTHLNKSKF